MKAIKVIIDPLGFGNGEPIMYFEQNESAIFLTGTVAKKLRKLRGTEEFYLVPAEIWERKRK